MKICFSLVFLCTVLFTQMLVGQPIEYEERPKTIVTHERILQELNQADASRRRLALDYLNENSRDISAEILFKLIEIRNTSTDARNEVPIAGSLLRAQSKWTYDQALADELCDIAKKGPAEKRRMAIELLPGFAAENGRQTLTELSKDPEWSDVVFPYRFQLLSGEEQWQYLADNMKSKDPKIVLLACNQFSNQNSPQIRTWLKARQTDKEIGNWICLTLASLLQNPIGTDASNDFKIERTDEELIPLTTSENEWIRENAFAALTHTGRRQSIDVVIQALKANSGLERYSAASALRNRFYLFFGSAVTNYKQSPAYKEANKDVDRGYLNAQKDMKKLSQLFQDYGVMTFTQPVRDNLETMVGSINNHKLNLPAGDAAAKVLTDLYTFAADNESR